MSYPGHHIVDGRWKSDKFPELAAGLVAINTEKQRNWPGLLLIADAYQEKDSEFAEDLRGVIYAQAEVLGISCIEMPKNLSGVRNWTRKTDDTEASS